jgi:RNA polymerase sigma-70 factor, ECF subfamily
LKVLDAARHYPGVEAGEHVARSTVEAPLRASIASFTDLYEAHFDEVVRWMRALGAPEADWQDLSQEVFCVVRRKLPSLRGDNLRAWLYGITRRVVKDHRRLSWFRHIYMRSRDVVLEDVIAATPNAEEQLVMREDESLLFRLIDKMSIKRRSAFVLFEIEGYSAEEIAELEDIPVATVYTRLHHARKDYVAFVEGYRREGGVS